MLLLWLVETLLLPWVVELLQPSQLQWLVGLLLLLPWVAGLLPASQLQWLAVALWQVVVLPAWLQRLEVAMLQAWVGGLPLPWMVGCGAV